MKKAFVAAAIMLAVSVFVSAMEVPFSVLGFKGNVLLLKEFSEAGDTDLSGGGFGIDARYVGKRGWGVYAGMSFDFPNWMELKSDSGTYSLGKSDFNVLFSFDTRIGASYVWGRGGNFMGSAAPFVSMRTMRMATDTTDSSVILLGYGIDVNFIAKLSEYAGLSAGSVFRYDFFGSSKTEIDTYGGKKTSSDSGKEYAWEMSPYIALDIFIKRK